MKILNLHSKNIHVQYKHSVCSFAALFVLIATIFTAVVPFYVIFYLYHDLWSQYKIVYEQPTVKFQYKYIFMAENSILNGGGTTAEDTKIVTCHSYNYLNDLLSEIPECSTIKVIMIIEHNFYYY